MTDSTGSLGRTRSGGVDHSRDRTADADALTPDSPSDGMTYLTLFTSLFSVGTGLALFTLGDAPTGSPVPLLSLVFLAAGVLVWFAAALELKTSRSEAAP